MSQKAINQRLSDIEETWIPLSATFCLAPINQQLKMKPLWNNWQENRERKKIDNKNSAL